MEKADEVEILPVKQKASVLVSPRNWESCKSQTDYVFNVCVCAGIPLCKSGSVVSVIPDFCIKYHPKVIIKADEKSVFECAIRCRDESVKNEHFIALFSGDPPTVFEPCKLHQYEGQIGISKLTKRAESYLSIPIEAGVEYCLIILSSTESKFDIHISKKILYYVI